MNPQKAGSEPGPAAAARPRPAGASPVPPVPPRGSAGTTGTAQGFRRYRRPLRGSAGPAPPAAIGAPGKSAEAGACGGCGSAPAPLPPLRCCRCENYALGADMRQRFAIRQDFLPGTSIFVGCGFYFGWGSVWFFFSRPFCTCAVGGDGGAARAGAAPPGGTARLRHASCSAAAAGLLASASLGIFSPLWNDR